jgi:MarR-like DNA-binding transcriptional regulator SgrR of sgrS sRNA
VRLPQEVIDHVLTVKLPAKVQWNESLKESIDMDWWLTQKGWNQDSKSFKALTNLSFGVLTIYQIDSSEVAAQGVVLREFLFKAQGFPYRLRQVKRILAGEQVTLTGQFLDYEQFKEKTISVGLHSELREMTFEEYHSRS